MSVNHGGVCLLYRDDLHAQLINTAQYQTFEHIAVFIHGAGLKSLFVVIYRPGSVPPSSSFFDEYAELLERITSYSSVVIMGDVNIHLDVPTDSDTVNFMSLLSANNLVQLVESPTHTFGHTLDVVIVSSHVAPAASVNTPAPTLSDHSMIDVELDLRCSNLHHDVTFRTCRSWRTFDYDAFERDLRCSALVLSPPDDVSQLVADYENTLKALLDVHAPYRRVRQSTRPSQLWYDAECRAARRSTRSIERRYRRRPSTESLAAWKTQFAHQRHLFYRKAKDYWSNALAEHCNNPRQLWSTINKVSKPPTASKFRHSADDIATHFTGKVTKIRASTATAGLGRISQRQSVNELSFQRVTVAEVVRLLGRAPSKHCVLDPAPTWLVKRAADVLGPVIAAVCNTSLQSGFLPASQKQARVTARLKKPSLNPDDLNSFRPISNVTFLSKLVERVVARQFTAHANKHDLFPVRQSAYRHGHSTETAVMTVHNDIVSAIDKGHVVALALLDLSSAFDTVDHTLLLSILENRFSVTGLSLEWFRSYLTDRTQIFTAGSTSTSPLPLIYGVPQGSGLGPVKFIAYTESTTDTFFKHNILYHLFADDTQIYDHCCVTDVAAVLSRLSACVDDLNSLYSSLCLQLNPAKTEFIWFGSRSNLAKISPEYLSLTVASSSVRCVHTVRNLGVIFDSELSMKSHISKTASVCFFHLRRLRQLRGVVTDEVMKQLVTSLVLSRLDYCNSVLYGLPASTLAPLQRVQNAAARLVLRLDHRAHIKPALQSLHWLPMKARIEFKIMLN